MRLCIPALVLVILTAASCSRSSLSQYYYLTPLPETEQAAERSGPAIGVETVSLPAYVDRESIVTSKGDHRLTLEVDQLWAEPLEENCTRVLSENLASLLGAERVEVGSWPRGEVQYRVTVRVVRLIGSPGGEAVLDARWTIGHEAGNVPPVEGETRLRTSTGTDIASYVAALSKMFTEMSREIASAFPR